jgi:hypothetical protein
VCAVAGSGTHQDQGPAVAGAVPGALGAGPLGAGVDAGALAVGAAVGAGVGVPVGDEVGTSVGKGVESGSGGPVPAVDSGTGCVVLFVACGVVEWGLRDGVIVVTGVGVVATVGTGGSMR